MVSTDGNGMKSVPISMTNSLGHVALTSLPLRLLDLSSESELDVLCDLRLSSRSCLLGTPIFGEQQQVNHIATQPQPSRPTPL